MRQERMRRGGRFWWEFTSVQHVHVLRCGGVYVWWCRGTLDSDKEKCSIYTCIVYSVPLYMYIVLWSSHTSWNEGLHVHVDTAYYCSIFAWLEDNKTFTGYGMGDQISVFVHVSVIIYWQASLVQSAVYNVWASLAGSQRQWACSTTSYWWSECMGWMLHGVCVYVLRSIPLHGWSDDLTHWPSSLGDASPCGSDQWAHSVIIPMTTWRETT